MADNPVDLDAHRGKAARKASVIRRLHVRAHQADQATQQRRQDELKYRLLGDTAETWAEAVAKAQYFIDLFATTPSAQELRRNENAAHALDEFTRRCDRTKEHS